MRFNPLGPDCFWQVKVVASSAYQVTPPSAVFASSFYPICVASVHAVPLCTAFTLRMYFLPHATTASYKIKGNCQSVSPRNVFLDLIDYHTYSMFLIPCSWHLCVTQLDDPFPLVSLG